DAFFWKGANWYDLTQRVVQDNNLDLGTQAFSSFTVNESAGTDSYVFAINNGQLAVTGAGTRPLPDFLASGVQTYNYVLNSSFSYRNEGGNAFSLSEQGSRDAGSTTLGSVVYS